MQNYDTSTPGMPYIRANQITIHFPPTGKGNPIVSIEQREAVKLTDGNCVEYNTLATITHEIDIQNAAGVTFDLVDLETDQPYGAVAGLPQLIVLITSYVRSIQRVHNQAL